DRARVAVQRRRYEGAAGGGEAAIDGERRARDRRVRLGDVVVEREVFVRVRGRRVAGARGNGGVDGKLEARRDVRKAVDLRGHFGDRTRREVRRVRRQRRRHDEPARGARVAVAIVIGAEVVADLVRDDERG